ncbi:MAG: DsbA family protein [Patescibacteria group bacterium]
MGNFGNIIASLMAVGMVAGVFLVTSPAKEENEKDKNSSSENPGGTLFEEDLSETFTIRDWNYKEENMVGNPQAPVLLEQYSDYACGYCVDFWENVMPKIKEEFIDAGYVKYVYKDFITTGGEEAALAAWCANEQGAFWQYHDALYSRADIDRHRWRLSDLHKAYAEDLGLNKELLVKCFNERRYDDLVYNSKAEGKERGVMGAPFFFVNGEPIVGFRDFDHFKEVIREKLRESLQEEDGEGKGKNDE